MEKVWCWRCKQWVGAMDEQEYQSLRSLYHECVFRGSQAAPKNDDDHRMMFEPMVTAYERLTGTMHIDPDEILKHRMEQFGPPCQACGKNLRTPVARTCFECGQPRAAKRIPRTGRETSSG
ncbi:MAG TPA: hypothetical protein VG711_01115 [Phycisphaerales bacterium]|nr:hypothetical protein [Phycisphaerales bacterium]